MNDDNKGSVVTCIVGGRVEQIWMLPSLSEKNPVSKLRAIYDKLAEPLSLIAIKSTGPYSVIWHLEGMVSKFGF